MTTRKDKKNEPEKEIKLAVEYKKYFQYIPIETTKKEGYSLAQPHVRKVVQSVVTYGAYEDPI